MKTPSPFPPFDADDMHDNDEHEKNRTFIPLRFVIPNIITIMAIVCGLSSVCMAFEKRFELAVILLLVAAVLDGVDGRIARAIKGSSRFGEQLDSLADAINFGVVPALLIYIYILERMDKLGWLAALIYSVACCLRLARFNVMLDDTNTKPKPKWKKNYFIGVPSPGGGCILLLPVYLGFLGMPVDDTTAMIFCFYTVIVAIPVQLFVVIYFVLLVGYMWLTLAVSTIAYLVFLPLSAYAYRRHVRISKE